MKITILTLTGQRDKFIDQILGERLRDYGHEVLIRNYIYAGREAVCYEKPDVVIHPFPGGQYKYDFIKACKEWGIVNIVRRGEAGMGKVEFDKLDKDRKTLLLGNWDYGRYVDLELIWGQEFADIVGENKRISPEKLRVCGAFAFDPYFTPYCKRNTNHEKTILFATGFSTCDCKSNYCECGLPEESDYHQQIYAIHRKARDNWIKTIGELVHWFGMQWQFELKVRPGEMLGEYKEKLPDVVKIHPQESPSSEVLKTVDILVHSGSTMAVEAHLLNIPAFNFCNVNPDPLLSKVSPMIESYEALEWNLGKVNTHLTNINEDVYFELQKHLYGRIDGMACERAAEEIHEHISDRTVKTEIPNTWPKTTKYHEDKERIHLEKQEGDASWLCPSCRNVYYLKPFGIARCPYCSMQIEMTSAKAPETEVVLK